MNIVIIGCGKIGSAIVSSLVNEGHDVVAVDNDAAVLAEISNVYDVMCVCGNGADCDTLSEAGIQKAEIFIAVTGSDELNMLSCFMAKRMGARHTVARIRNPEYNDKSMSFMKQQLGISVIINPEMLVAQEIFNILKLPNAVNIETFSRRNFEMVQLLVKEDSLLDGEKISELRKKYKAKFLICTVRRGEKVYIPDGNFVLEKGDRIGLTAETTEIQKLLRELGILQRQARNIMLLGASRTSYYLAKLLLGSGNDVKIIDVNRERCTELCNALPSAVVICGDGASQELLLEEGVGSMDAFVALTGIDEENILISCFAESQSVKKVIAKVNRTELADMAEKLGLESVISPKRLVSDVVSRYARAIKNSLGSNVETLYRLLDGKAEALEFNIQNDSKCIGVPIKDLSLKPNILIAGILRGRKAIIPSGEDIINADDRVVVIAAGQRLNDFSDIIR